MAAPTHTACPIGSCDGVYEDKQRNIFVWLQANGTEWHLKMVLPEADGNLEQCALDDKRGCLYRLTTRLLGNTTAYSSDPFPAFKLRQQLSTNPFISAIIALRTK